MCARKTELPQKQANDFTDQWPEREALRFLRGGFKLAIFRTFIRQVVIWFYSFMLILGFFLVEWPGTRDS